MWSKNIHWWEQWIWVVVSQKEFINRRNVRKIKMNFSHSRAHKWPIYLFFMFRIYGSIDFKQYLPNSLLTQLFIWSRPLPINKMLQITSNCSNEIDRRGNPTLLGRFVGDHFFISTYVKIWESAACCVLWGLLKVFCCKKSIFKIVTVKAFKCVAILSVIWDRRNCLGPTTEKW